ncbi:DUF6153 family protein [Streptomyces sp. ODS05-4]|uniref:DUF6153 family protein n=1 Tax=Streptomyces sp. ODS05-4 TaxID=2944939 RepID=UPI0021086597|nr:DUF6153 family protein [Streptomyces sp. ODS05-4]
MSTGRRFPQPRPTAYQLLLVLAVLAGVAAMHGLAPGPATVLPPSAHGQAHAPAMTTGHVPGDPCDHLDAPGGGHGGPGGHLEHADPTCAASGVSTAPAPAPLAPSGVAAAADAPGAGPSAATATDRAPPDLARLQLLRI